MEIEKKPVHISVKAETSLSGEKDVQRNEYRGFRYEHQGKTYLRYQAEGVKTMVRVTGETVDVHTWLEETEYTMPFYVGQDTECLYPTAHGAIPLKIRDSRVNFLEADGELHIRLQYQLESGGTDLGLHRVKIVVRYE